MVLMKHKVTVDVETTKNGLFGKKKAIEKKPYGSMERLTGSFRRDRDLLQLRNLCFMTAFSMIKWEEDDVAI